MSLKDTPIFTSLPAHDIDRAKRWYEDKLGLDADDGSGRWPACSTTPAVLSG